ncbi:CHAT domain-containing protein [Saccharothrix saharensis]|uniref:CHAT domain-containing protein n=1 Tax=Saccharothrix saharensis TaxID=571190 RepID=A0A543JF51_9PSEU|nr:CHAT domain-containing tetratricopeptide repeat protein [Saccharothrix saharensis]TQM81478.1 CHAT domain-containing protein [Saccharothrix saharensis]
MPRSALPVSTASSNGVEVAADLHKQAFRAASRGRPADAVTLLRRALRALPVMSPTVEATTVRIRILITLSYGEAETESVEGGLAHLRTAAGLIDGLPEGPDAVGLRAIVKDQQALILHRAGRTAEAIALYDESVRQLEAGWASGAVGAATLATALMNRGLTTIAFGLPEAAERDMRRAIELAEADDLPLLKAKALGNLGDIAHLTGDVPRSLAYHEQAERVFRLLAPDLVPRTRIDRARVMLAAGLADEAARHLDEALVVLRRRRVGQDLAEAELARAAAALLQGDPTTAHHLADQAQRRFRRRGSKSWAELAALMRMRADFTTATTSTPAGHILSPASPPTTERAPQPPTALPSLTIPTTAIPSPAGPTTALSSAPSTSGTERAPATALPASGAEPTRPAAPAIPSAAGPEPVDPTAPLVPAQGRPAASPTAPARVSARLSPSRATRLAERLTAVGLTDEAAVARLLAVRMAIRRGDLPSARALLAEVPPPGPITPIDHRMLLRLCRAELAVAEGEPGSALREAEEGLAELGRVRDRMGGLDLLCGTAVHGRELGELAVGLVLDHDGDAEAAFDWLERTRAQVYRYEPLPAIDDPVLARRVAQSRSLTRAVQQARLDGRPVAELEERLDELQREVARLGWHTSVWGRPRPVCRVADVHPVLSDRAMVSFVTHGDVLSAVVLVAGEATLVRLGRAAGVFESARELHADVDALGPDHLSPLLAAAVRASAARRAERLDEALIGPLAGLIGERELVVVPTGDLYAVPWNALPSLHGRPIVVAPSATAWLNALSTRTSARRVVLVAGPNLPEVVGEVSDLRGTYPDSVTAEAVSDVLASLNGARLAHIAAHGEHVADNALFSRLELVDGPLFAHETARLPVAPERVILAACSLALSHIRPGDEALGFAGALLASGSRTVVAAVNQVGDRAAALAMGTFHKLLSDGKPLSHALAEATAADPLRRPFVCFGA